MNSTVSHECPIVSQTAKPNMIKKSRHRGGRRKRAKILKAQQRAALEQAALQTQHETESVTIPELVQRLHQIPDSPESPDNGKPPAKIKITSIVSGVFLNKIIPKPISIPLIDLTKEDAPYEPTSMNSPELLPNNTHTAHNIAISTRYSRDISITRIPHRISMGLYYVQLDMWITLGYPQDKVCCVGKINS